MKETAQNYRGLAWLAAVAFFMQALDATILNTALPAISAALGESPLNMQMAVISYSLTVAALIPLSGWLADKFGTLTLFRTAVALFIGGSVACACSGSLNALIWSRVLQGIGGALMMPVARLAIIRNVPKEQLVSVWNLMATAGLIGPILGPILGGWLVIHISWHWIFLINIPIGLFGIAIAHRFMPNTRYPHHTGLDWIGFILFSLALVCLTFGLEWIAESLAHTTQALSLIGVGIVLLWLYRHYARRTPEPLFPLTLLNVRTFRLGLTANLFIRLCGSGVPFLLPLMFQVVFGYRADNAGWLIAPIALGSILSKPFVRPMLDRFGYRRPLMLHALLLTLITAAMGSLHPTLPLAVTLTLTMAYGAVISILFTAVNTLTVADLDQENASTGATLMSVIQQVGIGIGIAVAAVILALYRQHFGENGEALQQAFRYTYLSTMLFGFILFAAVARLRPDDGDHLRKKSKN